MMTREEAMQQINRKLQYTKAYSTNASIQRVVIHGADAHMDIPLISKRPENSMGRILSALNFVESFYQQAADGDNSKILLVDELRVESGRGITGDTLIIELVAIGRDRWNEINL